MKKNQVALMCLTAVIMLAVWYIKSPIYANTPGNDLESSGTPVSTRLTALTAMRDVVRNERSIETANYEQILGSETSTIAEKNRALNAIQELSDLTEQEVLMELSIINLGYTDAFVHKSNLGVEILVIADALSTTEVVEIMNMAYSSFDQEQVVVSYKPASFYVK